MGAGSPKPSSPTLHRDRVGAADVPATASRRPAISTGNPELDPLVSFLRVWFAREIEAGMTLVIEDHTKVHTFYLEGSYEDYVDGLLKEASDQAPAEMIRNFGDRNRESRAVWPELMQFLPSRPVEP